MQGKELSWHQVPCPRDPILLWIELYPVQAGRGAMASVQMWHYLGHVTWSQCGPSVGQCVHTDPGEWSHLPVSLLPHCPVTLSQLELWVTRQQPHRHTWAHILAPPRPRTAPSLRPPAPASSPPPPAPGRALLGSSVTRRGLGGAFQRRCLYLQLRAAPRRASISWAARQPRQLAINIQPPATSSRNTELHLILLHGDIQQYLVH